MDGCTLKYNIIIKAKNLMLSENHLADLISCQQLTESMPGSCMRDNSSNDIQSLTLTAGNLLKNSLSNNA